MDPRKTDQVGVTVQTDQIAAALYTNRVDTVFGVASPTLYELQEGLQRRGIQYVSSVHEQDACHAAQGYAWVTGVPGVCVTEDGASAANAVTAVNSASMDSVPLVVIVIEDSGLFGNQDESKYLDTGMMTAGITKHHLLIREGDHADSVVEKARFIAGTGRPGPVLVEVIRNGGNSKGTLRPTERRENSIVGYNVPAPESLSTIEVAADLIFEARRPLLYVGGGVVKSDASDSLLSLAETMWAPVTTTLMALGAFPDRHPLHLGMPGMHGRIPAVAAFEYADLVISLGARFDDRVTGDKDSFASHAKVIHVDIDPAELSKNRVADVEILADCDAAIKLLRDALEERDLAPRTEDWWELLEHWIDRHPLQYSMGDADRLAPQYVMEEISRLSPENVRYCAGVGQHQMWAAHFLRFDSPRQWINSGGSGTMGYAVPAAMGAKVANPDTTVWAIDGDGSFQMSYRQLTLCSNANIPIKVAVINNSSLGMVRQQQTLQYDTKEPHRYPNSEMPDFVKLAQSMGCHAFRCNSPGSALQAIENSLCLNDRPTVIDFRVHEDQMVWPMVPAGEKNMNILIGKNKVLDWNDMNMSDAEKADGQRC